VGNAKAGTPSSRLSGGLNLNLPAAASPKDSNWNKLRYYEQAEKDSQRLKVQMKSDPLFRDLADVEEEPSMKGVSDAEFAERVYGSSSSEKKHSSFRQDANEQQVYDRLSKLQRELSREPGPKKESPAYPVSAASPDIKMMEMAMQQMQQPSEDPELGKLDQMLDKIIAIQNPDKVQEDLNEKLEQKRGMVYTVAKGKEEMEASCLGLETGQNVTKGFFSLSKSSDAEMQNTVRAVIHETQTLVNGATVKLRLVDDIKINGVHIPRESFVYGEASLSGERLRIVVSSIRSGSHLFPVQLVVYDMDGLPGVRVPGAISKQVIQQSTDRGLQGLGFNTVSSSVGLQAASLGVEAAKSFLSRKVKQVRVTVKAGYQVLLKDGKQKDG